MLITIKKSEAKRVFILEDDWQRQKWFMEKFSYPTLLFTMVRTAHEAKGVLSETKFDLIFLDHDLDENDYGQTNNENNTGYEVAKHIPSTINKDTEIIVHSMNPIGAGNIAKVYPLVVTQIPFDKLRRYMEVV